jgi:hypothetical protein
MLELDDAGVPYSDPECDAEFDRSMIMTVKQLLMFSVQISYGLVRMKMHNSIHYLLLIGIFEPKGFCASGCGRQECFGP